MKDALQDFLDETSPEPFRHEGGGCGGWSVRWAIRRTGRAVPLPALNTPEELDAADVPSVAADFASRLGLLRKARAERGDTGVFRVDASFETGAGRHVVGICLGDGWWAFKTMHGVKMKRATPIEVWG